METATADTQPVVCSDVAPDRVETIADFARKGSGAFIRAMSSMAKADISTDMAGLEVAERHLLDLREGFTQDFIPKIATAYGAFIGEVLRSEGDACWAEETEAPEAYRLGTPIMRVRSRSGEESFTSPVAIALKHLGNGQEDSPSFKLKVMLARAK